MKAQHSAQYKKKDYKYPRGGGNYKNDNLKKRNFYSREEVHQMLNEQRKEAPEEPEKKEESDSDEEELYNFERLRVSTSKDSVE